MKIEEIKLILVFKKLTKSIDLNTVGYRVFIFYTRKIIISIDESHYHKERTAR